LSLHTKGKTIRIANTNQINIHQSRLAEYNNELLLKKMTKFVLSASFREGMNQCIPNPLNRVDFIKEHFNATNSVSNYSKELIT
jgi:hypothetical protein